MCDIDAGLLSSKHLDVAKTAFHCKCNVFEEFLCENIYAEVWKISICNSCFLFAVSCLCTLDSISVGTLGSYFTTTAEEC